MEIKALIMAKWYLEIGWSLIPIVPKTKQPAVKWTEYQTRKAPLEEVTQWIKKGWYLAVVTGSISGICIVDDDRVKHGFKEWGFNSSIISKSENNGKHYYFKYDRELHSHSNATIRIDLKGWHSYCLLPPFNGREWINKPSRINLSKLTPLDDDTVRLINSDTRQPNGEKKKIDISDFIAIDDGARTDSLHKIACSLFTKHPEKEAIQILLGINQTYNPPLTPKEFDYQVSRAKKFIEVSKPTTSFSGTKSQAKVIKTLSVTEVARSRIADKELEKDAPKTGYPEFDRLVKGFLPKHFWTITGETNAGKTTLAANLADNVRQQGKKVLYVALEPEYKTVDYIASARLNKPFEQLTDEDLLFDDGNIEILTLAEVPTYKDLVQLLKDSSTKYDVVFIDHVGYFISSNEEKSFLAEQAKTIRELVGVSKQLQNCIVVIAHPRKPEKSKKIRILNIYDISGSASFAQDSTEVISLYRPTVNPDDPQNIELSNVGLLLVLKTKAGVNGTVKVDFRPNSGKVTSIESVNYQPQVKAESKTNKSNTMKRYFVGGIEIPEPVNHGWDAQTWETLKEQAGYTVKEVEKERILS